MYCLLIHLFAYFKTSFCVYLLLLFYLFLFLFHNIFWFRVSKVIEFFYSSWIKVNPVILLVTAAYISPDTVMVREIGSVSFKAIPEDKPLEVIYMAPELQQKGILNEKVIIS